MEYSLLNSNDKESIVQYLQEFFLNDEMERVLLGCHSNNVASSTVIRKCGGALVNTKIESEDITNCYYEILL